MFVTSIHSASGSEAVGLYIISLIRTSPGPGFVAAPPPDEDEELDEADDELLADDAPDDELDDEVDD